MSHYLLGWNKGYSLSTPTILYVVGSEENLEYWNGFEDGFRHQLYLLAGTYQG